MTDRPRVRVASLKFRNLLAFIVLGSSANMHIAAAAPAACGAPQYDKATETALFLWKDCVGNGAWHVRVTGGGSPTGVVFEGSAISVRNFRAVTGFRLESADLLDTGIPKRLDYRLAVWRSGQDGFTFTATDSVTTCFDLKAPAQVPVLVGAGRAALTTPLNLTTLASCGTDTITVHNTVLGNSTRYIGAVEGDVDFNPAHFRDLGINAYRIYGGMSRWEAQDDDGVYGSPTITQIKANPNRVNWAWWDNVMTNPPQNSDYWWSGEPGKTWGGNARQIFRTLRQEGIRPILTIRNVDNAWNPLWAWQLNPPRTQDDRNEWWEHVFATVYWLNVRNNYRVDDFEIHNEPDNQDQGWAGTQTDYFELVKLAKDAIDHVYRTYLPGRSYHIHAPKTVTWSNWPLNALRQIPDELDSVNIHNYAWNISTYVRRVHQWMNGTARKASPLWLGEWGTYENLYNKTGFALNLVKNMIRASQPGDDYVYGSTIFSLYDWGDALQGLIGAGNKKRLSYFGFRMGIRALQGGRTTLATTSSNPDLVTIASRDASGRVFLLLVNSGTQPSALEADFGEIAQRGAAAIWEFRADVRDKVVANVNLNNGRVSSWIPAKAAVLIRVQPVSG